MARDAKIAVRIIHAWDTNKDEDEVLNIFLKEKDNLSDERYWELLRTVWVICGSVGRSDLFRSLMLSKRKQRFYFSTPEEHEKLRSLPDKFEVYRACNTSNATGMSWTLSREYVELYKQNYGKDTILTRVVDRSEVFAYINRNNEEEESS